MYQSVLASIPAACDLTVLIKLYFNPLVLISLTDLSDGKGTEGEVATRGLKYNLIQTVKQQAAGILANTDWYITRNTEKSTAIPSAITTHRDLVRSRQATMETQITNASDTQALKILYTYTTNSDGVQSRPLAELPTLEI